MRNLASSLGFCLCFLLLCATGCMGKTLFYGDTFRVAGPFIYQIPAENGTSRTVNVTHNFIATEWSEGYAVNISSSFSIDDEPFSAEGTVYAGEQISKQTQWLTNDTVAFYFSVQFASSNMVTVAHGYRTLMDDTTTSQDNFGPVIFLTAHTEELYYDFNCRGLHCLACQEASTCYLDGNVNCVQAYEAPKDTENNAEQHEWCPLDHTVILGHQNLSTLLSTGTHKTEYGVLDLNIQALRKGDGKKDTLYIVTVYLNGGYDKKLTVQDMAWFLNRDEGLQFYQPKGTNKYYLSVVTAADGFTTEDPDLSSAVLMCMNSGEQKLCTTAHPEDIDFILVNKTSLNMVCDNYISEVETDSCSACLEQPGCVWTDVELCMDHSNTIYPTADEECEEEPADPEKSHMWEFIAAAAASLLCVVCFVAFISKRGRDDESSAYPRASTLDQGIRASNGYLPLNTGRNSINHA